MVDYEITNLELRESKEDGSQGAGLAHVAEGMVLLTVRELALDGEPRGGIAVVHDLGDTGERYVEIGAKLRDDGWAVTLPDLRGHGKSEGIQGHSWGLMEVLRDIDSVFEHIAYMAPSVSKVLLGQGMGALNALAHAVDRPGEAEAIVGVGTTLAPRFDVPAKKGGLGGLLKRVKPTTPGRLAYGPEQMMADAAAVAAWKSDPLTHEVITVRGAEAALETAARIPGRIGDISVPVLLVHGDDDPIQPVDAIRALESDRVHVRVLEGAGHDVFHGPRADEAVEIVRAWLDERFPRR